MATYIDPRKIPNPDLPSEPVKREADKRPAPPAVEPEKVIVDWASI